MCFSKMFPFIIFQSIINEALIRILNDLKGKNINERNHSKFASLISGLFSCIID